MNTRPARSKREPWHGQRNPPGQLAPTPDRPDRKTTSAGSPGRCRYQSAPARPRGASAFRSARTSAESSSWNPCPSDRDRSSRLLDPRLLSSDDVDDLLAPGRCNHLAGLELADVDDHGRAERAGALRGLPGFDERDGRRPAPTPPTALVAMVRNFLRLSSMSGPAVAGTSVISASLSFPASGKIRPRAQHSYVVPGKCRIIHNPSGPTVG